MTRQCRCRVRIIDSHATIRPRDRERRIIHELPEAVHRARVQPIRQRCREVADDPTRIPITMLITVNRRRDGFAAMTNSVKAAEPVTMIIRAAFSATASSTTKIVRHRHDVIRCKALLRALIHLRHRHHYYLHLTFDICKRSASIC